MTTLQDKFGGCLLGAAIGDIAGAVVEAESPGYIAATYRSIDDILSAENVPEFTGPAWRVGRFTDDTQMMLAVAEWLLEGEPCSSERLLARFAAAYEPWRRYGSETAGILRIFSDNQAEWRQLSTAMFPHGSYGNGSATRVAPVGLAYCRDLNVAASLAIESSRPTHSHPLAYQGSALQCVAVATAAASSDFVPERFLKSMRASLTYFSDLLQDTSSFTKSLNAMEDGIERGESCRQMSTVLGTGVTATEAVPMAVYCFLRHPYAFTEVIREAVFLGGDTDTIASMAGAISGAFLGADAIPSRWLRAVREDKYSVDAIAMLADKLFQKYGDPNVTLK